MFEFEDAKLGKVKVVNVTEARSSMASIMNDRSASYVITRNNRPIRVILSYDKVGSLSAIDLSKGVREATPSQALVERKTAEQSGRSDVIQKRTPVAREAHQKSAEAARPKDDEDHSISALAKQETDYFMRFKKLYEPVPEPPAPKPPPPKTEPVVKAEAVRAPLHLPKEAVVTDPDEVIPEPPRENQDFVRDRPSTTVSPKDLQPLDPPRTGRGPPSIQDLLRELEQEKLSGEEDDLSPLNSSDLRRLFHDIS